MIINIWPQYSLIIPDREIKCTFQKENCVVDDEDEEQEAKYWAEHKLNNKHEQF